MIGYITPISGNTEFLRDWLIEHGAKYSRDWGWYFDGDAPVLPIGLTASPPIHWEELTQPNNKVYEFVGNLGERIKIKARCTAVYSLSSSAKKCYHFLDDHNRTMVWFTEPRDIALNEDLYLTGTVKRHQVFRDQGQTILTRCKIEPIDL